MKNYIVSQDRKTGLWYAHMRGYQHVPVSGSFSEKRRDAAEYAKMYNGLPHKVDEIERKRREAFEKEMEKASDILRLFLLLGKQNQVFIGSYSVEAKRRLKSTCWRSKQEQISDRRPVFFRLKNRFSVFVICFWLASATKNCSDS